MTTPLNADQPADRDPERLKDIVSRAIAQPRAQREAFIAHACAGDAPLADEARALLAAHDAAGSFMGSPTNKPGRAFDQAASTIPATPREGPGTRVGPYKLLELIGEGGFGSVFLAEQSVPMRRRVALKIIKLGMDTRSVVARFEQERQALAMMDHPNIARVLDAGATETGRPFFVMEYVKGDPVTTFADAHKLNLRKRLELFIQVCHAVQHAHTKGVIHRDIKPSNVLVSMVDGKPLAKVIDFGIAKATGAAGGTLTDKTLFTEHRQLIGTLEYMSPEQAEGSPDIDTRTDVYGLGVLLYELLAGATPFDAARLRSAAFGEMQRIIKEEEPPAPSLRLSRDLGRLASTAATRDTEPTRLGTLVRGELDWIVMKALDKDRVRRYESPNQLAADVQRHLSGEAVVAAPPGAGYRLRKFVRRNKGPVLAGSAVTAALLFGMAGTTWQWHRAEAKTVELEEQVNMAKDGLSQLYNANMDVPMAGTETIQTKTPNGMYGITLEPGPTPESPLRIAPAGPEYEQNFGRAVMHMLVEHATYASRSLRNEREKLRAEVQKARLAQSQLVVDAFERNDMGDEDYLRTLDVQAAIAARMEYFGDTNAETIWAEYICSFSPYSKDGGREQLLAWRARREKAHDQPAAVDIAIWSDLARYYWRERELTRFCEMANLVGMHIEQAHKRDPRKKLNVVFPYVPDSVYGLTDDMVARVASECAKVSLSQAYRSVALHGVAAERSAALTQAEKLEAEGGHLVHPANLAIRALIQAESLTLEGIAESKATREKAERLALQVEWKDDAEGAARYFERRQCRREGKAVIRVAPDSHNESSS